MTTNTDKISRKLKSRSKALLQRYDVEDLHQLRVNIRRARALLIPQSGKRSAALRKQWGRLARKTNAARDWDTLAIYAAEVLPSQHWHTLQPLVEDYRERARQQVLKTLQSHSWDATLSHWRKLVKRAGRNAFSEGTLVGGNRLAAERALKSSRRALTRGDERSWHKCRIAVKNLRYKLENTHVKDKREQDYLKAVKSLCKRLQNELGDWHDTVVHSNLLAQIADDPRAADEPDVTLALNVLGAAIEARGSESLMHVGCIIERDGQILAAAAGDSRAGNIDTWQWK